MTKVDDYKIASNEIKRNLIFTLMEVDELETALWNLVHNGLTAMPTILNAMRRIVNLEIVKIGELREIELFFKKSEFILITAELDKLIDIFGKQGASIDKVINEIREEDLDNIKKIHTILDSDKKEGEHISETSFIIKKIIEVLKKDLEKF